MSYIIFKKFVHNFSVSKLNACGKVDFSTPPTLLIIYNVSMLSLYIYMKKS